MNTEITTGSIVAYVKGTNVLFYIVTKRGEDKLLGRQVEITKSSKSLLTFKTVGSEIELIKSNCSLYKRKDLLREIKD